MKSSAKSNNITSAAGKVYVSVRKERVQYRVRACHPEPQEGTSKQKKASDFTEHSRKEILAQINFRLQQPDRAYLIAVGSVIIACLISSLPFFNPYQELFAISSEVPLWFFSPYVVAITIVILGSVASLLQAKREKRRKITILWYALDEGVKESFHALQNSLAALAASSYVWRITFRAPNWDWKRKAGASSILGRERIKINYLLPAPFLRSNVKICGLDAGTTKLFFLPDQILLYRAGKYFGVNYGDLLINTLSIRFIETESVPRDSRIVDETWQYVRKDGGPDLRFSCNFLIPIVEYGHIELLYPSLLNLELKVSNPAHAHRLGWILQEHASILGEVREISIKGIAL